MKYINIVSILLAFLLMSCGDDFMNVEPKGAVSQNQLDDLKNQSADAVVKVTTPVILGAFTRLHDYNTSEDWDYHDESGLQCLKIAGDLMGEDVVFKKLHWYKYDHLLENNLKEYRRTRFIWNIFYKTVKDANTVLGMAGKEKTESAVLNKDIGQALFLRAFGYFRLVRYYQYTYKGHEDTYAVPYMDETMFKAQPKAKVSFLYEKIVEDLTLAETFLDGVTISNKTTANINVVKGMLARVYLTMENWPMAAQKAAEAKAGYALMNEEEIKSGFTNVGVNEMMWGFKDSKETSMSILSFTSHMSSLEYGYVTAVGLHKLFSGKLAEKIGTTDIRRNWVVYTDTDTITNLGNEYVLGKYYNKKYYDVIEGSVGDDIHMRAAEMWLIEAEAKAHTSGGAAVLEEFMESRDPNYDINANGLSLLEEIYLQRRIELWGEGFRLFDLLRLKKGYDRAGDNHNLNAILSVPAGGESSKLIYQIPKVEQETNFDLNNVE